MLLTASAHAFQNSMSFVVGHLLVWAFFQNKQMYCTRADSSSSVQSFTLEHFCWDTSSLSEPKRLLLDVPCTVRLEGGLPGVLPSATEGLLDVIVKFQPNVCLEREKVVI